MKKLAALDMTPPPSGTPRGGASTGQQRQFGSSSSYVDINNDVISVSSEYSVLGGQDDEQEPLEVGTPVWVKRRGQPQLEGEVAYLGTVKFAPGDDWVGVRLKEHMASQGKNAGAVDGVQYFETSSPYQGLFVRRSALKVRFVSGHHQATTPPPGTAQNPIVLQQQQQQQQQPNSVVAGTNNNTLVTATTTTTPGTPPPPPRNQNMARTPMDITKSSKTATSTVPSPTTQQTTFRTPMVTKTTTTTKRQEEETIAASNTTSSQLEQQQQRKSRELEEWRMNSGRKQRDPSPLVAAATRGRRAPSPSVGRSPVVSRSNPSTPRRRFSEGGPHVAAAAAAALAVDTHPDPQELANFAQSLSPSRTPTTNHNNNNRPRRNNNNETDHESPNRKNAPTHDIRSISLNASGHTSLRRGLLEPDESGTRPNQDMDKESGSWSHALICTIFLLGSLVPPTLLAVSLMVPRLFPNATIVTHGRDDWFLTRFTAGLILGQVATSFLLLLPMLYSCILCCCCCGAGRTKWFWNAARIAGLLSAWMGLLSLILALWLLSSSSHDKNAAEHQDDLLVLLGGSAGTMIFAALGLALSFWPTQNTLRRNRGPHIFRRNQYPVLNTVVPSTQHSQDQHENGLLEPLLLSSPSSPGGGHPDDEEAALGATAAAATTPSRAAAGEGTDCEQQEGTTDRVRATRRLLQLASSQVLYLYLGCLVLLVRLPFSLAIPHFVSTTLTALGHGEYQQARLQVLYLFVLGSIDAVLDFWCIFLFGYANLRIVKGVRVDLFQRLLGMEVAFFDTNNTGTLASRLNSDCSEMAGDLTWFFRFSIESVVRITGITAYMIIRSPRLGACALSIIPVVGVVNKFYGDWLRKNAIALQDALAEANAVAQEALSNVRTVIAFAAEGLEADHYRAKIEHQYNLNVKQLFMTGVYYMSISTFLINTFVQAALLYYGAYLIEGDGLTADVLLAFMLYQGQLQQETLNLFQSFSSLIKSSGAGDKVFALLDRRPPPPATGSEGVVREAQPGGGGDGGGANQPLSYELSLQRVSFAYPTRPTQRVLDNMVLDIPRGSTVALVGPSGCGKTTVINLLQRFYDPTGGAVILNGLDLRSYDLQEHRRRIGVVSQDCVLFDGSILENITYGSHRRGEAIEDPATLREVRRAATLAHADGFIEAMPQGYHTIVGEKGVQLSGGQRQRISIARAIYQRPLLLILDEATSALDRESEKVVQEALDDLLQNQRMKTAPGSGGGNGASPPGSNNLSYPSTTTTVVIAHRLHTVQNADYIAVLSEGHVAEFGPPQALMRRPRSLYRQLVERATETGRIADS